MTFTDIGNYMNNKAQMALISFQTSTSNKYQNSLHELWPKTSYVKKIKKKLWYLPYLLFNSQKLDINKGPYSNQQLTRYIKTPVLKLTPAHVINQDTVFTFNLIYDFYKIYIGCQYDQEVISY